MVNYEVDGHVAIITLNSPDTRNALNKTVRDGLVEAVNQANADDNIRCAILTGKGKAFCAGVDLKAIREDINFLNEDGPLLDCFRNFSKPLIGAINGFAMTGGLELALNCDFRYASPNAVFADTHAVVGLMPTWGLSQNLPRLIGVSRAKEMSFTAKMVDANTALNWGLIDAIYDEDQLLAEATKTAHAIANNDGIAVQGIKKLIDEGYASSLQEGLNLEDKYSRPHNDSVNYDELFEKMNAGKKKRS